MENTLAQPGQASRAKSSSRWKIFWVVLASLVVVAEAAFIVNNPVGDPTVVQGNISQRCVPFGEQGNFFHCTAKLGDGSSQVFTTLRPVETGAPVSFLRYGRRFFGAYYENKSF
jgi:hypothetical protein